VLCICTARPDGPGAAILDRLERRRPGSVTRLGPLSEAAVRDVIAACLDTTEAPVELDRFVWEHSDGSPFLVEELLAGLAAAGALEHRSGRWEVTGALTPSVPASLRESISRRLGALGADDRRVLGAAALLGRHFEWDLLPGIAEVDGRAAVDALRAAVREQLIEPEGDGFSFRHALTREAVLADLLPPERRELAARAWPAIERAAPGLPGPTLELAADLAEAAGDPGQASIHLIESARRALDAGALATAETTARRARALTDAAPTIDGANADEVLVHVLAAAGKTGDAIELGSELAGRLAIRGAPVERQVDLLLALARAAVTAGRVPVARQATDDARRAAAASAAGGSAAEGSGAPDPAVLARIDAVAADVALVDADLLEAEELARRAIDEAQATEQPAVLCEALLTLGRTIRPSDRSGAQGSFERSAAVASEAGLARWHLRARQETALYRWNAGDAGPLRETRALAARYGAHLTVAVMDLSLADIALSDYDHDACLRAASDCVEASRRFGLATEPVAHLWVAGAHALAGDDDAMQAAIDAALSFDPDDPRILGDLYGRVLVTRAYVRDELDDLRTLCDEMVAHVHRAPPTTSVFPGRSLWALLHTIDDDDLGVTARAETRAAAEAYGLPILLLWADVVDAVALGRSGALPEADARITQPYEALTTAEISRGMTHSAMLVVARAAIRDGWGDAVRWLRTSEAWFAAHGFDRLVRRSRALLQSAGAPVPRRGRGDSEVPPSLRAMGVTSREVDVLKLVIDGRSTKEIAAELFLSPKTVERHLTSLFDRTGVRNRRDLAALGADHLP
jgi:DNA-binding CsgD family transcriptional regulator